jgi:hypothetical protein
MKPTVLFLALLSATIARAQTPTQPMTDKVCDRQGKSYVTEKNKDEPAPEPSRSFYWDFLAAHYDSQTDTCYVRYNRFVRGLGTRLEQIRVDDIEGNYIAAYSATWASDSTGYPTYTKPSECKVDGASCESKAEFENLLGKVVPSLRKNTPRVRQPVSA